MGKIHRLSDSEKELLNVIGRHPEISMKELLNCTTYKWGSTVKRRLEYLKKQGILRGPIQDPQYTKLCKNPLHKVFCILESDQSYDTLMPYLRLIEPIIWVFPVLSPHKNVLNMGFLSSNITEMTALFQLLKDNGIITEYIVRIFSCKRVVKNPDFFGDPVPSLDNLLDPRDIPDLSLQCHDTVWNQCDIAVLPYLQRGTKLIEILREEMNLHRTWTYEQIRYSRDKMVKNGLIEKVYAVYPFMQSQCAHFVLFLKTDDTALTQRILCNFARGGRIYKEYVLCGEWGMLFCLSHPLFLADLMNELDRIDEITQKELYQIRSVPTKYRSYSRLPEIKYYDFDKQTLEYPYHVYREKIVEKLDSESVY